MEGHARRRHCFSGVLRGRNPTQFERQFVRHLGEDASEYEDDLRVTHRYGFMFRGE